MADKDYYKILGVEKNASKEDIKAAYKRLAKQYHPDLNKEAGAADKFKEINEAASVLGDDDKRRQYDQYGSDAFKYNGAGGGQGDFSGFDFSGFDTFDFDSIFDTMFGGGGYRRRGGGARSNRGRDLIYEMIITLEEANSGIKRKIKVTKNDTCEECDGEGGFDRQTCPRCNGQGAVRQTQRTPFGLFQATSVCPECQGSGETFKKICKECEGTGRVRTAKTIEVNIPAGIMDGGRLRVNGEGEAGFRGGTSGDLYILVRIEEHDDFVREGDDLLTEETISFAQAALGDKVEVMTINGKASLKIPAGTQPGTVLRMKGEGIKHMNGFGRGDQLVKINVEVPTRLSRKQEQLLRDFEKEK